MEMHQVRYFLAVCETLNFTRAAASCSVAQPSLTRAIKKLEEELGGPLFRRERNLTHLSDLGRLTRPHLEQIYRASLAAQVEADHYARLEKAHLQLGLMCTIGPTRIIGFLDRLRRDVPAIDISFRDARGTLLVEELMNGDLDIALVGLPAYPERVVVQTLYKEHYVIAFPKGHRFEALPSVSLRDLDGKNYVSRSNCEWPAHFDNLGRPVAFEVNARYASEREDWVQAMILAGMGCSIMPEYMPILPGIATRLITDPQITRRIGIATVAGREFSPAVRAVVNIGSQIDWDNAG